MIFILPVITLILFFLNIYFRGNNVPSIILFILAFLPLMDLKITMEAWGGFKIFDAICFYSFIFLLKDFTTIKLKQRNNYYLFLFVMLFFIVLFGGLASAYPDAIYLQLVKFLPIFIFGRFLLTECLKDRFFHLKAIKAIKISYMVALCFLIIQVVIGLKFTFYPSLGQNTIDPVFHIIRYPGVFYDSQAHGQFLALGSFLFLYIERGATKRQVFFNYLFFVLAVTGIIIAGSRAAFGGFVAGLLVVFFVASRKYFFYGVLLVVLGFTTFTIVAPESGVFDRTQNLTQDYLFRQTIWKEAFDISKEHPYLGIGSGNYQNYVRKHNQNQYLELEDGEMVYFDQPENGYLKIMVELGYFGFLIFILFMLTPLFRGFNLLIRNDIDKRAAFLMASLISWLVAFNTVYSIYDYRLLIMVTSMVALLITFPLKKHQLYETD